VSRFSNERISRSSRYPWILFCALALSALLSPAVSAAADHCPQCVGVDGGIGVGGPPGDGDLGGGDGSVGGSGAASGQQIWAQLLDATKLAQTRINVITTLAPTGPVDDLENVAEVGPYTDAVFQLRYTGIDGQVYEVTEDRVRIDNARD
jgi:hypothetical protein